MYIKFPIIPIFGNNAFDYIAAVRYDREQELHNVIFLCQFYYGMQIWYGYAMIVNFQKSVDVILLYASASSRVVNDSFAQNWFY